MEFIPITKFILSMKTQCVGHAEPVEAFGLTSHILRQAQDDHPFLYNTYLM